MVEKEDFIQANVHYGGMTSKWHPRMRPYIFKKNKKNYLFYLPKIVECFNQAQKEIKKMSEEGKTILFVGTDPQVSKIVKEVAISCHCPYLVHRWLGGFLTNFETINRRIRYLQTLVKFQQSDNFVNWRKKEKRILNKKIEKLNKNYEGVITLKEKPQAIFVVGVNKEKTAIKEARRLKIPIIAIANTNCDPDNIDYLVPGNDRGEKSLTFFLNSLAEAIKEGREERSSRLVERRFESKESSEKE